MTARRAERTARLPLPDALLSLAASLADAGGPDEALDRLTRALADRGVGCALFVRPAGGDLQIRRATLPLAPHVWGRPLRLPRLAGAVVRTRPVLLLDTEDALTETVDNGRRPLLTDRVAGPMIVAPLRAGDADGVLCVASSELSDADVAAVWGLALQLGAALRPAPPAQAPAQASDEPLFHDLTRRLSYSLSADEAVRAGLEVLAPALGFQIAAAVACTDGEDVTTVYAAGEVSAGAASRAAAAALDAFLRLTGDTHHDCRRPPFRTARLDAPSAAAPEGRQRSSLEAPLVTNGEVRGLLWIGAAVERAFDGAGERTFYTVANQLSLAIERVDAQRAAERAQLASLADSLSDGVVLVDAGLRVTSMNGAAGALLAQLAGGDVAEGDALSDRTLAGLAQQALDTQRATPLRELPSASTAAGRRYLKAMAAPLAGSPEGSAAVVIVRDVTEERLMQERLLQSEKMVSVGQLVSGVAHELNNPLAGISTFAQLLLAEKRFPPDQRTAAETIYSESRRASRIVQNLLTFARQHKAEKVAADINSVLHDTLELRTYELNVRGIQVVRDFDERTPPVTMVDVHQLQQVILNLIT
ncbi:MAG: hypothetical protein HY723_02555, partial [Chloroflexi bacterium]|nr:hypothetical protein [Chloroflexota bacterium]